MNEEWSPAAKLRVAFELFDAGVDLMRQNLRRRHPDAGAEEIAQRLQEWLLTRPGAEHGDSPGRPRKREEPAA